ncbi:MAG: hypothetical protein CM15mP49_16680 [Actinomycetota bacterium]|nr:MAG: hypothetical protein CM15mP49_16680 [Actinomycetota bacterium]
MGISPKYYFDRNFFYVQPHCSSWVLGTNISCPMEYLWSAAYAMIRLMADGTKIRATDFVTNTGWGLPTILAFSNSCSCYLRSLIGLPALRIRGVQLAVVTIAAVIAIENLLL